MKRPAIRCFLLATAAFLWLHGIDALAQAANVPTVEKMVFLKCGTMGFKFHPGLKGEWARASLPASGDSTKASADSGRGSDNDAGDIYISTGSAGETTITYGLKDGKGNLVAVRVKVVVNCAAPPGREGDTDGPQPFVLPNTEKVVDGRLPFAELPRAGPGAFTHRLTGCPACKGTADKLNAATDLLAAAREHLIADEIELVKIINSYPETIANEKELNSALKEIDGQQTIVNNDFNDLRRQQRDIRDLAKELNECEKKCNPPAAVTTPTQPEPTPPNRTPTGGTSPDSGSNTTTPKPKEPSELRSIEPGPGTAPGKGEQVFAPPITGPGGMIVATVVDPNESGPHSVIVATVDDNGGHHYLKTVTNDAGRVAFAVPAGVAAFDLFEHFDPQGQPSVPVHTVVGATTHMTGSVPLPSSSIPSGGPAILEGSPAIQPGEAVALHTRGTDPMTAKMTVDGEDLDTLAESDRSVVARLPDKLPLGMHKIQVTSDGKTSNTLHAVAVTVQADPVPLLHVGQVKTLQVHVAGLPAGQKATMHFTVGGAATVRGGGTTTDVPVKNGTAKVEVQATRSGQLEVGYDLDVPMPED